MLSSVQIPQSRRGLHGDYRLRLVAVGAAVLVLHCPQTQPDLTAQVQGPTASYQTIFSGMDYGPANGGVQHVIAGKNVVWVDGTIPLGQLDVVSLQSTDAPRTLNATPTAYVNQVAVSQAAPEALLFLEEVNSSDATGNLMLFKLGVSNSPGASAVPAGGAAAGKVPSDGYYFGANGNELLFIANYDHIAGTGQLYWSDGTQAISIGAGASPTAIVLSQDRKVAVAGISIDHSADSGFGLGQLVAIDMATGATTVLGQPIVFATETVVDGSMTKTITTTVPAQGVTILVDRYAQLDPGAKIGGAPDIAFSVSADGSAIAFEQNGIVQVARTSGGNANVTVLGTGRYPGLSPSGQRLGYFANAASQFVVYDTANTAAPLVSLAATVTLAPQFSPDDAYVAYLEDFQAEGTPFGGDLGSVWIMRVPSGPSTSPVTFKYATDAAWHSFAFWPLGTATSFPVTTQMSVLADEASESGAPSTNGTGNLYVDDPTIVLSVQSSSSPVSRNIVNADFALLPSGGGFDMVSSANGPSSIGEADVWVPLSATRRPGTLLMASTDVLAGSFLSTAIIPHYSGPDASLLVDNPSGTMFGGAYPVGDLLSVANGEAYGLKSGVFAATFSNDGASSRSPRRRRAWITCRRSGACR